VVLGELAVGMTIGRFAQILRTRYETGAYGQSVFRMSSATLDDLRARFPARPEPPHVWELPGQNLACLLDIPVLLADLPDGVWEMAERNTPGDNTTWLVVESGTLE